MRYVAALFAVVLLWCAATLQAPSALAHGCAPFIPPPVSGSPTPAPATSGTILINEVLSVPGSTWNCAENGTFSLSTDSWVELYNLQNQPLDLYAVHASLDDGPNSHPYYLPLGAAIAPHGFLVLFPSVYSGMLVAGSTLRLVINGVTIDQVSIPALAVDQSYARTPDGASNWQITSTPTIDASNTSAQITPTPQGTPASQLTPAPTSPSSHGGTGGNSYGGTTSGSARSKLVNGVQPQWNKLQFPAAGTTSSAAPSTINAPSTMTPSPSASSGPDLPHLIAMALIGAAFALVLFWCWRLFSHL